MEWQKTVEQDIGSATAEELSALAKQYLLADKALIVIGVSKVR
jgi:hypothetical protein